MTKQEQKFITTVWDFYHENGRHTLPWRKTASPYRILVSEIMLQQTQVERVIPKYQAFIKAFPTVKKLAAAPLSEVLVLWQGLGYNRRAKLLHECAKVVMNEHKGRFPSSYEGLVALPGVGPYTAGAVLAFAYNEAVPILETNIRTVYLFHFFRTKELVSDAELRKIVEKTLDKANPRAWYAALMDYGSYLKRTHGNNTKQSRSYTKQSTFKGSDRQIRGALIRCLTASTCTMTERELLSELKEFDPLRIQAQLARLVSEGLVEYVRGRYCLPT
jgi:A/G-specific adenine glycosylase